MVRLSCEANDNFPSFILRDFRENVGGGFERDGQRGVGLSYFLSSALDGSVIRHGRRKNSDRSRRKALRNSPMQFFGRADVDALPARRRFHAYRAADQNDFCTTPCSGLGNRVAHFAAAAV